MYKTTINKQFSGKGFIDVDSLDFISTGSKDNGTSYNIQEILSKVAGKGEEVTLTVKVTDNYDSVDEE